jgi:hypothetical protein
MNQDSFKYDVAFSFLAQDEALASELNDLLQDRLKTFLYSKEQEAIAGTDGEETFNKVFGEESRIVVVLNRFGWGETPWTRIEKTSIRNRAYEDGYNFVLFIPLDEAALPKWLPKTQLWIGLSRWGINGAASVIEALVQEQGGIPHVESVQERATRFERALKFAERREQFLNSHEGVRSAEKEFEFLDKELQHLIEGINDSLKLQQKRNGNQIFILGCGLGLSLFWKIHYANSLVNANLILQIWDGHPPFPGIMLPFEQPKKLNEIKFNFDLTPSELLVWRETVSNREFITKELASYILKYFIEKGQNHLIRN